MAKIFSERDAGDTAQANEILMQDKTTFLWYSKGDSKQITFCKKISDLIGGNGETHEFVNRETFFRDDKNAKGEPIKRVFFIIFTLENGTKFLVYKNKEIK